MLPVRAAHLRGRLLTAGLLLALGLTLPLLAPGRSDLHRIQAAAMQRWGDGVLVRFNAWQQLVQSLGSASDIDRLRHVNYFFNRQTRAVEDPEAWGQPEYWATPMETLGRGAGDCEDFAIAKYFTLLEAGVAPDKLRLIYVRARIGISDATVNQAHMVLAYYPQPEAEPLLLDNLIADIKPASRRPDLIPVFSFSREGVFTGISGRESRPAGSNARLSRWENLLQRVKAEGFD